MTGKIYCIRHAHGQHNTIPESFHLHDPKLSQTGIDQCINLKGAFPHMEAISTIIASPLRRTLQTALIVFEALLNEKSIQVIALPELQEASDMLSDTGSDLSVLEEEFGNQPVDLSRVGPDWNSKRGVWAPGLQALDERARVARKLIKTLTKAGGDVVVISHGAFLHLLTDDWDGYGRFEGKLTDNSRSSYPSPSVTAKGKIDVVSGTGWANAEWRTYHFEGNPDGADSLTETDESLSRRGTLLLTRDEQQRIRAAAEEQWREFFER